MNRLLPFLLLTGCLAERAHERDVRMLKEVEKQERWAQDAVSARPPSEELARIRSGDPESLRSGRKALRRLVGAVDRGTWIRDAAVESLRDDGDDPALAADFERAGRTRNDALQAADELAAALAEARDGVKLADLRAGLEAYRRARDAETRLAKELALAGPGKAPEPAKPAPAKADPARAAPGKAVEGAALSRLATVALPTPKPFVGAIARFLWAHPQEKLSGFAAEDATEIRAHLAELENHPPEPAASAEASTSGPAPEPGHENASPLPGATADGGAPDSASTRGAAPEAPSASAAPGATSASAAPGAASANAAPGAKSGSAAARAAAGATLTIANDAARLLAKRGAPRSFATREGGLFALRYEEQRPCGVDTCPMEVDYLFDAQGKLVRDEATPARK